MTTIRYTYTDTILADSRLEAIMCAGAKLRTGVRVEGVAEAEQSIPGWWSVTLNVAEDIGANDPEWPGDLTDHPADATVESEYGDLIRWGP